MAGEIAMEAQTSSGVRRQPLLSKPTGSGSGKSRRRSRLGMAAGECAAVCCCCPCAVMHVVLLAVYGFPRSLWIKAKRMNLLENRKESSPPARSSRRTNPVVFGSDEDVVEEYIGENDVVDWDKELMERFGGLGFFRSDSERETVAVAVS